MNLITVDKSKAFPKEVWIGWISSLVEAYNMAIYSFIAPLLAPLLLQITTWGSIFFSYSLVFLSSCLLDPTGAIYYGLIGDRYGRQKICVYSTLGLAIATGLMGFIPIHLLKDGWLYFLALISAQHFFSEGEYHGSIVFSLEHSEQKQNGLMNSLSCLFAVFGLVFANGLATLSLLKQDEIWIRVCFLTGGAVELISYFLKNHCRETLTFCTLNPALLKEVKWFVFVKQEWRKVVSVISVLAFFIVSYTFIFIFLPLINIEANTQSFSKFKSLIAYGLLLILSGTLSDRIEIQKIILTGIRLFSIAIIPSTVLCNNLFMLQMILTPCVCLVIGPIHSWMLHQFNVSQRCREIFMCSFYPLILAVSTFGYLICMRQEKKVLA